MDSNPYLLYFCAGAVDSRPVYYGPSQGSQ
jgi:hypothetical protein